MDRACISCRRKRRVCDGSTPCRPCFDADIVCDFGKPDVEVEIPQHPSKNEFEFTPPLLTQIPFHGSAVKNGESSASHAQPKAASPTQPTLSLPPSASAAESKPGITSKMPSNNNEFDMGIGFIHTLVQKTLQNLSLQHPGLPARALPNVIEDLFNKSAPSCIGDRKLSRELPSYDQTRKLTRTAIDHIYLLSNIVSDAQLVDVLEKMRSIADWSVSRQYPDEQILLHIILALGYLSSAGLHLEAGCHYARDESTRHFMLVKLAIDNQDIGSHIRLQALFCMILFLVATSKISAAHTYMNTASAAIYRLVEQTQCRSDTPSSQPAESSSKSMLKAALFLDTCICGLLGVPCILQPVLTKMASIEGVTQVIASVTQLGRNECRVLEVAAFDLHLELFGILSDNGLSGAESSTSAETSSPLHQGQATIVTNTYGAEKQLKWWSVRLGRVFPHREVNPRIARLRHELQMSYFQVGLVLYYRFLPYHAYVEEEEDSLLHSMIEYGNSGLDLAKRAISTSDDFLRYHQVCPASWQTVYSLFLAIMGLLFALTADGRDEAELRRLVKEGTLLLNVMSCSLQPGVLQHLTIVKSVADKFDPPVDIGALPVTVPVTRPRPTREQRGMLYSEMPDHPGAFRQRYQSATVSSFCQRGQS